MGIELLTGARQLVLIGLLTVAATLGLEMVEPLAGDHLSKPALAASDEDITKLQAIEVTPEGLFLSTEGQGAGITVERSPDQQTLQIILLGVVVTPTLQSPSYQELQDLGIQDLKITQIATAPLIAQITLQVSPEIPDWEVITSSSGLLLSQALSPSLLELSPPLTPEPRIAEVPGAPAALLPSSPESELSTQMGSLGVTPTAAPRDPDEIVSPLAHPRLHSASQLGRNEVVPNLQFRLFSIPDIGGNDTASYATAGISWGVTDNWELTLGVQQVDSLSPGRQGAFVAERVDGDQSLALEVKRKLWSNEGGTQTLSGIASLFTPLSQQGYRFLSSDRRIVLQDTRNDLVPALQVPWTITTTNQRAQFTLAPTVAFFPASNAIAFRRPPVDEPGSFGTTLGLSGGASYQLHRRLAVWGDFFAPITGNNSISRESGKPAKAIAYNAGLRYLVNPQVGLDVFASNTQGGIGPLALTADRDFTAVGTQLAFMPELFQGNRRYADSWSQDFRGEDVPDTVDGLAFFDGGTVPEGQLTSNLQVGGQGLLAALRYGVVKDLEAGVYLDLVTGDVDESEQGYSAKVRLLNQAEGSPLTVSLAGTIGLTNQPFINFFENDRNQFEERNLKRELPLYFPGKDDAAEGKFYIATLAVPLHYQISERGALWLTPVVAYVQRRGVEIAGFNAGGAVPVLKDLSLVGEVGANFAGEGNAFIGDQLANAIPWTVAIRWDPTVFLGGNPSDLERHPQVELYFTNRVGSSTWHQLRVQSQNKTTFGVGVSIPF